MTEAELITELCHTLGWPSPSYDVAISPSGGRFPYYLSVGSEHGDSRDRLQINVKPRYVGWVEVSRFQIFSGYYRFDLDQDGSDLREIAQLVSPLWHRNWFTTRRSAKAHLRLFPGHLESAPRTQANGLEDPCWPMYVRNVMRGGQRA